MSFLCNMAVTQATALLHLRYILQILPCQPLLQNASQDPTADCRDKAPSYPFNVMERQKGLRRNYGRRGGDRETEKCGKENGISPCRCNKLDLAYPVGLHLQKTFHMYQQGWNGQAKGSDATEQKLSATHTWRNMWHEPLHLTCSSHRKKEVSLPAGTEAVPLSLTSDINWLSGREEVKAVDFGDIYFLLPGTSFPPPGPTQPAGGLSASSHRNCVAQRSQWHCATHQHQ